MLSLSAATRLPARQSPSTTALRAGAASRGRVPCVRRGTLQCNAERRLPDGVLAPSRRQSLVGTLAAVMLAPVLPGRAEGADSELVLFQGVASPPTSYGGYGGNAEESFKYSFMVPSAWKTETINKTEKGTQGVDCKFTNPKVKGMKAFVIALGRSGEDAKAFKITDVEGTFASFAGADYDIQDALTLADEVTYSTRDGETGEIFYEYDIDSPINHYQASISTKRGKIFALFIKTPAPVYETYKELTMTMLKSFKTL